MIASVHERLFSVREFRQMVEAGMFGPEENVELLEGRIVVIPPQGPLHASTVRRLMRLLLSLGLPIEQLFDEKPILLGHGGQPVPDIALVEVNPQDPEYRYEHPTARQVRLAIEVADSTAAFDLGEKARACARGGLREYWVVDLPHNRIVQHTEASENSYLLVISHPAGSGIQLQLPDGVHLDIDALFAQA
ncbi:Uma2 family endonuclease [Gloeobacter kilaueensis]|uniref:Putative restriction endonuclease domain-containing protein n=1 Tax=Gloeobacter kilaueensis (strain ATCC BAA-2537 / CCAP 1431/1 / ULC 316 / JS1) TaxID=1183438 RepID=U5QHS2_GLOK1|nr:Uma2 family endonuclease [Gloeobacter kilaueensis]AGY58413.1 hypothetical protein GKIL_2167 [Gloeobacter kilaueensis JS1]